MDLNKVMIIGHVTKDPEVRSIPSGQNVASFGVATNLIWTDAAGQKQEKVEFHNIVAWRRLADICSQYLRKGSRIYVEGRLQTRSWDDPTGVKKYRTEIIMENMIMLDRANANPASNAASYVPAPQETAPTAGAPAEEEINIEDIPF